MSSNVNAQYQTVVVATAATIASCATDIATAQKAAMDAFNSAPPPAAITGLSFTPVVMFFDGTNYQAYTTGTWAEQTGTI